MSSFNLYEESKLDFFYIFLNFVVDFFFIYFSKALLILMPSLCVNVLSYFVKFGNIISVVIVLRYSKECFNVLSASVVVGFDYKCRVTIYRVVHVHMYRST